MAENQLKAYETSVSEYKYFEDHLQNFNDRMYSPELRLALGQEIFPKDPENHEVYFGQSPDRVYHTLRDVTKEKFGPALNETNRNLTDIVKKATSANEMYVLDHILNSNPIETKSWTKVTDKHKKVALSRRAIESKDYDYMINQISGLIPKYSNTLHYLLANQEDRMAPKLYKGIHAQVVRNFADEFMIKSKKAKEGEMPKIDKDRLFRYTSHLLRNSDEKKRIDSVFDFYRVYRAIEASKQAEKKSKSKQSK